MKKKRFSVEQITSVLQQVEGGVPVGDVCRQVGVRDSHRCTVDRGEGISPYAGRRTIIISRTTGDDKA